MNNTRSDGFYWVRLYSGWTVCEWKSARGIWFRPGNIMPILERDIDTIYETPLLPPNE